jgi:ferredoxin
VAAAEYRVRKGSAPADADEHKGEAGKFDKYFSPEPGKGE